MKELQETAHRKSLHTGLPLQKNKTKQKKKKQKKKKKTARSARAIIIHYLSLRHHDTGTDENQKNRSR